MNYHFNQMRINKGETVIFADPSMSDVLTYGKSYLVLDVVDNRISIMNDEDKTPRLYSYYRFESLSVSRNKKLSKLLNENE